MDEGALVRVASHLMNDQVIEMRVLRSAKSRSHLSMPLDNPLKEVVQRPKLARRSRVTPGAEVCQGQPENKSHSVNCQ